MNLVPANL